MIVVFGSVNVDLVVAVARLPRPGETVLGGDLVTLPGGKGANQAVAARRAGASVALVGAVGTDAFAALALRHAEAVGVDLTGVRPQADRPTGTALIAVAPDGISTIVVSPGANAALAADMVPAGLLRPGTTLLLQREVPDAACFAVARRAVEAGARVILNNAPYAALPAGAVATIDVAVVNRSEMLQLGAAFGLAAAEPIDLARAVSRHAGKTVVLTLGDAGAVLFDAGAGWRVGALPVDVVDTTGAGDAFLGAFAAGLDAGLPMPEAFARGAVAGSLACTALGAQTAAPGSAAIDTARRALAGPTPV